MPTFSPGSLEELRTCDEKLQNLCHRLINVADITIVCGHRGKREQNKAHDRGHSQLQWPLSYHNAEPSLAVDIAPWVDGGIAWSDFKRWKRLVHLTRSVAASTLDVPIIVGADWDMDLGFGDESFHDWGHVQLDVNYEPEEETL